MAKVSFGPEVVDAKGAVLGRLAAYTAKRLLLGERIVIVNAAKVVISGSPLSQLAAFERRRARGDRYKGPFYPKYPDRIVKRAVRGMLPKKRWAEGTRGRAALARLKVYIGCPEAYAARAKPAPVKTAEQLRCKWITLQKLCYQLGAKL
jgi:large subunit ribosomal protein L13